MTTATWKTKLGAAIPEHLGAEIDAFEAEMELRRQGKNDEKYFAETRLRRGAYGQRYDNGQRHDGERSQELSFPCGDLTKGPTTVWDAPGMQRIKIPMGKVTAEQLEVLAECAEEYSDSILHITTRQDIQLHFIHIDDTPDMHRRLASVGITTREACGNSVRNVTACPFAGVCHTETFDVTPYAHAMTQFLLGHPDAQDFGRKFKIAFSGCKAEACGVVNFHDLGLVAKTRVEGGKEVRGFEYWVGGGLGSVPYEAKLFDEFLREDEILPMAQAISRVFARLGEKKNRGRARIKFLIKKLGLEEFRRLVLEERRQLREDPRWSSYVADLHAHDEKPLRPGQALPEDAGSPEFRAWRETNVYRQRQAGYAVALVTCPLGDFTPRQARALADLCRKYSGDHVRFTVDQNLVLRWVSEADLPALHGELVSIGLGQPGAGTLSDVTACPGTDTCKLGIASSRGLASELRKRLDVVQAELPAAARNLHVKASGCFNACGQHHVADIGFLGVSRSVGSRKVPHFQLVVGGEWANNAGSYGLAIVPIPSKRVPMAIERLARHYVAEKQADESFVQFVRRVGKAKIRGLVEDLTVVPSYEEDPSLYTDWGDPREFTIGDLGVGECAGEVVAYAEMGLAQSERQVFEAQVALEQGDARLATDHALGAMVRAAVSLTREKNPNVSEDPAEVISEFRKHLYEPQLFWDPYAGGKFAQYFFHAFEERVEKPTVESARQLIEEALLFIEAAHACYQRLRQVAAAE